MTDSKQNINKLVQDVVRQFVTSQMAEQPHAVIIGSLESCLILALQELPEDNYLKKVIIKTLSSRSKS